MITEIKYDKKSNGRVYMSWMYEDTYNELCELHPELAADILQQLVKAQVGKSEARTTQQIIKYIKRR